MEKSCPCIKNLRNIQGKLNEIFRQNTAKIIQILRLFNTILYTPGPRDNPHRVASGSGTGPLDFESPGPVPDP